MTKVFVYGSLKKGFGNHHVISKGEFISVDETLYNDWHMFNMGGFPGVVEGTKVVTGEVYEVDDEVMAGLDRLEGNGSFYTREIVELSKNEMAWMYILPNYNISESQNGVITVGTKQTWTEGNIANG